jgi:hypothetical protein
LFLSQWSRGFLDKTLFFILSGLKPLSFPLTARFYETMFSKWYPVIFITLLPPLSPCKGGKQEKSSSLPFIRGGLGRGEIFDTAITTLNGYHSL